MKDLIENMIKTRKEEARADLVWIGRKAAADATKKAYCEEEQGKTKAKLEELAGTKEKLSARARLLFNDSSAL